MDEHRSKQLKLELGRSTNQDYRKGPNCDEVSV